MSDKPKRRWYQFSLRSMLIAIVAASVPLAWWSHRQFCLAKVQSHADRNFAATGIISPLDNTWRPHGGTYLFGNQDGSTKYLLVRRPSTCGQEMYFIAVERGILPEHVERAASEMAREAHLADDYFHAIYRPWERLWIDDREHNP